VSHLYGFGLMDAESMVKEAVRWKQVPLQHVCAEEARIIYPGSEMTFVHETTGCVGRPLEHVAYVEHVIVRVTITHHHRGNLYIKLLSPSGTKSELLAHRPLDNSSEGFQNWEFMTTHCWGEKARGRWTLKIKDISSKSSNLAELGALKKWSLVIYGTAKHPYHVHHRSVRSVEPLMKIFWKNIMVRLCDQECTSDGCEGPGPNQCVMCLHFFLKFKNNTRLCVSECPKGFWGDRRRCKRCFATCESCTGSRSDQCTSCQPGQHLTEGTNTCTTSCGEGYYLDHDASLCRKCSENCLKCTSFSICTECKLDTRQLSSIQLMFLCLTYLWNNQNLCHGTTGPGVESCKNCVEGYLMEEWKCVHSCSAGFYDTNDCEECHSDCVTCHGPGDNDCVLCEEGKTLENGMCVFDHEACPLKTYRSGETHTFMSTANPTVCL
uniref:P/Homo B domain-containing protein n=1 Tax=Neogobius melanostomus TaxID=47308 RepID=A0A8C6WFL9_9GOBI